MPNHNDFQQFASLLLRSTSSWEGCCTSEDRIYHALLCGDPGPGSYTLDLASGHTRLKVTLREDGSWLSRRGDGRGWSRATEEEVALAHDAVRSAVRTKHGVHVLEVMLDERSNDNVRELPRQVAPVPVARWLRCAAGRCLLAATFAFIMLAYL
jgi:hypothetical protein